MDSDRLTDHDAAELQRLARAFVQRGMGKLTLHEIASACPMNRTAHVPQAGRCGERGSRPSPAPVGDPFPAESVPTHEREYKRSEAVRANMAAGARRRWADPEQRARQSAAMTAVWARRKVAAHA